MISNSVVRIRCGCQSGRLPWKLSCNGINIGHLTRASFTKILANYTSEESLITAVYDKNIT